MMAVLISKPRLVNMIFSSSQEPGLTQCLLWLKVGDEHVHEYS